MARIRDGITGEIIAGGMTLADARQLVERERAVRDRALEIHEQRCAPETAANIREIARAEIEGREPSLISPFARV